MRILILGASGQLGSALCSILKAEHEIIPVTRVEADITDLDQLRSFAKAHSEKLAAYEMGEVRKYCSLDSEKRCRPREHYGGG